MPSSISSSFKVKTAVSSTASVDCSVRKKKKKQHKIGSRLKTYMYLKYIYYCP